MVKRLINTMDFESLETKMKKCKVHYSDKTYPCAHDSDIIGAVLSAG